MNKKNREDKNSAIEKVEEIASRNTAGYYGVGADYNFGLGASINNGVNGGFGAVPPIINEEREMTSAERERAAIEAAHEKEVREKREEEKEKRAKIKREKREHGGGNGGWIAAVSALSVAVLILGSMLLFSMYGDDMRQANDVGTAQTERAFYDFVGYVDNMEVNMSKFFVSSDKEGQQRILGELSTQSNLANMALGELPLLDEAKHKTSKYINQVGDYAIYLNKRLIDGQTLSDDDLKRMEDLYKINSNLKRSLSDLSGNITGEYDFSSFTSNLDGDMIVEGFTEMEEQAKDYPEMIYDGPFSDGIEAIKPKGLNYEKVDETKVKEEFDRLFTFYETDGFEVVGKSENGKIETFNVKANIKEGGEVYAQFSVNGGKLVLFNAFRDCKNEVYTDEQCLEKAKEFLKNAGFESMTEVWGYSAGNTMHYNFVYEENGTLVYPDMVKVNVCKETGRVSGIDADAYFMNHTERSHSENLHSLAEAAEKVNPKLEIVSALAAIIPVGNGNEKEAYEFIATYDGSTYYVYIDALTLKQADIFKVVNTDEGTLLI